MKIKKNLASGMIHSLDCIGEMARYDALYLHFVLFPTIWEHSKVLQRLKLWDQIENTGASLWQYPLLLKQEYLNPIIFENNEELLVSLCRNVVYGESVDQNDSIESAAHAYTCNSIKNLFDNYVGINPHE